MTAPRALLYHSIYREIPSALDGLIHNVDQETFRRQMTWCKHRFDLVSADELFASPRTGGLCVTFDDANESVFSTALPILQSLGIPATVFINGASLMGHPLWRDKIRWLIKSRLVGDFLAASPYHATRLPSDPERFFAASKCVRMNSARLDRALDAFLAANGVSQSRIFNPVPSKEALPQREGIKYGNHGFNHYVLTSLTPEEQAREIDTNHSLIGSMFANPSRIFSVPFGHASYHDAVTWRLLRDRGYTGLFADAPEYTDPPTYMPREEGETLPCIGRIKAPTDLDGLKRRLSGAGFTSQKPMEPIRAFIA